MYLLFLVHCFYYSSISSLANAFLGNSFQDSSEPPLALDYVLYSTPSPDHWKATSCRILNDYVERPSTSSSSSSEQLHRHRPQDQHHRFSPSPSLGDDEHRSTTPPVTIDPMLSPVNTSETAQLLRNGSTSRMLSPMHADMPSLHITPPASSSTTDSDPAKPLMSVSDHAGVVVDFSFSSLASVATTSSPSLVATDSDALGDLSDSDVSKLEEIFAHGLDDAVRRRRAHHRRALFAFFVGLPIVCAFAGWYFVVASLVLVAYAVVESCLAFFVVGDEISNFEGKFMDLRFIRMRHKHACNRKSNLISTRKHF